MAEPPITNVRIVDINEDVIRHFRETVDTLNEVVGGVHNTLSGVSVPTGEVAVSGANTMPSRDPRMSQQGGGQAILAQGAPQVQSLGAYDMGSLYGATTTWGPKTQDDAIIAQAATQQQQKAYQQQLTSAKQELGITEGLSMPQRALTMATNIPGIGGMIQSATDDQGAFRLENIGQAAAFTAANAVSNMTGSAFQTASSLLNPFAASNMGMDQGLGGGDFIGAGPFQMRNPFGGEAFSARASQIGQALPALWQPGVSFSQALGIGEGFQGLGWQPNTADYGRLEDLQTNVLQNVGNGELKGLSDNGTLANLIDQMTRHGTTSFDDVQTALEGLASAAKGARIPIQDMADGAASVAEELSNKGLTYTQGFQAANDFTSSTNQHPQVMQMLMDNPMWQTQAMGQTQIPVQMQGLLAQQPGTFNKITQDTFRMMESTLRGVPGTQQVQGPGFTTNISGKRQSEAAAANALGIPIDTYRQMRTQAQTSTTQGFLEQGAMAYSQQLRQLGKQYGEGSAQYNTAVQQLNAGTGRFSGQSISLEDLHKLASRDKSGIDDSQWARVESAAQNDPKSVQGTLRQIISDNAPARTADQSNQHTIAFTGMAEKVLKEVLPGYADKTMSRRTMNQGGATMIGQYISSGATNLAPLLEAASASGQDIRTSPTVQNAVTAMGQ